MAHKKMKAQRYYGNGRNGWHHHVPRRGGNIVIFAAEKGGVVVEESQAGMAWMGVWVCK